MTSVVVTEGQLGKTTVSVFDRGFLYGDAVFEVVRVYQGRALRLGAHVRRMANSAQALGISFPSAAEWARDVALALSELGPVDAYVRLVLTRGDGLGLRARKQPGVRVVVAKEQPRSPPPKLRVLSLPASDYRRGGPPSAKTGNYLGPILAVREAERLGFDDALLVDGAEILEGSASNVLLVLPGGVLKTPPIDGRILPGITLEIVEEIAPSLGFRVVEEPIYINDLARSAGMFLSSSIRELASVVSVDDIYLGASRTAASFQGAYRRFVLKELGLLLEV